MSTLIKKLEYYLGVDLFVREKNSVEVTETCQEILPIARRILADVQSIRQLAIHASGRHRNMLSLGAFPSLASYVLPEYVFRIKRHYPDLKLQLVEEKNQFAHRFAARQKTGRGFLWPISPITQLYFLSILRLAIN